MIPTDLAYWFPKIEAAGLPVPETRIITADLDLWPLVDGKMPQPPGDYWKLIGDITVAGAELGTPFFLRTGLGSGKHDWKRTCFVESVTSNAIVSHVQALVEWHALVDLVYATDTWVVRSMIPTDPLFVCVGWGDFPVTREFRVFVRDDAIDKIYPYWPPDAIEPGRPDSPYWRERLEAVSLLTGLERDILSSLALRASHAVGGGFWSVDCLQDKDGEWWLTDMAEGDRSWRPELAR